MINEQGNVCTIACRKLIDYERKRERGERKTDGHYNTQENKGRNSHKACRHFQGDEWTEEALRQRTQQAQRPWVTCASLIPKEANEGAAALQVRKVMPYCYGNSPGLCSECNGCSTDIRYLAIEQQDQG